jgi:hypothetical protein
MGATSPTITCKRMVNFDANEVGQNVGLSIGYNRGNGTCTLRCHHVTHNSDGSVGSAHPLKVALPTK